MSYKPTIATIDPGIRGTGIAIWSMENWLKETLPIATYVITPPAHDDWVFAIADIYKQIDPIWEIHNVQKAYCEFPQYFTSGKGHSATAKGDIYKLSCLVGVFMGMMLGKGTMLIPIQVNSWKGQLPKEAVIARLLKREPKLADLNIQTHAWDAVGIGYYYKRIFSGLR